MLIIFFSPAIWPLFVPTTVMRIYRDERDGDSIGFKIYDISFFFFPGHERLRDFTWREVNGEGLVE